MCKRIVAVVAVVIGALGVGAPAFAANHPGVTIADGSGLNCLAPSGETAAEGTPIIQVRCTDSRYQRWDFLDRGTDLFQIRNVATRMCIDVFGGKEDGTPVVQWTCANISNQRFHASANLPNYVTLASGLDGPTSYCLDLSGQDLRVRLLLCNGLIAQKFGVFP